MKRSFSIVLGIGACLWLLAGCTGNGSSTDAWSAQLRMFVAEFVRNALAAFLI